jgi:FkbM family methyltransferase
MLSNFLREIESMLFRHSRVLYLVWRTAILPAQIVAVVSRFTSGLRGELFIDIGANVGYYARLLEHNFRRIIAVEADPVIFGYLKRNCHSCRNCKIINAAVADSNGVALLHEHPRNPGGSSVAYGVDWKAVKVRKISMSTLLENEPEADLVKVDVEGAELMVLKGAAPVMSKIRSWIIERHDTVPANGLVTWMKRYGYTCTWLDENHAYFSRQKQGISKNPCTPMGSSE